MLYISGEHALNLPCSLDTCGDWHTSALQWENLRLKDSQKSVFGEYGIEERSDIPDHTGKYFVANHIRALLDLIEEGNFSLAQGMKDDFICNAKYDDEIFEKVFILRNTPGWEQIRLFMHKEYGRRWRKWIEKNTKK